MSLNSTKMLLRFIKCALVVLLPFGAQLQAAGHTSDNYSAAEIQLKLNKLAVLGSVLHIGAHPDDENNPLIAWLAKEKLYRTAYLSTTRGDGGQNHIGSEKGDLLGMLRTQELLAARTKDGGEQFFTRAIDFGYSLTPEETLKKWGEEAILADYVWIIRTFRPDILIARFPTTGEGGHGHHTASAILAGKAFDLAGDATAFVEQLRYTKPWQPKRLVFNAFGRMIQAGRIDTTQLLTANVGIYNALLGKSYTEIAAEARSMHKCQGMGTSKTRGDRIEYFAHIKGDAAQTDLFDGIDTSWKRIKGANKVMHLIEKAKNEFSLTDPQAIVPHLLTALDELRTLEDGQWVQHKKGELKGIIQALAGLWLEAGAESFAITPNDSLGVAVRVVQRFSGGDVKLKSIGLAGTTGKQIIGTVLRSNTVFKREYKIKVPASADYSNPYWLSLPPVGDHFAVPDQELIGASEREPLLQASFHFTINGHDVSFKRDVQFHWNDELDGDRYRPVEITPTVMLNFEKQVHIFASGEARTVKVRIKSGKENIKGMASLKHPAGWLITPAAHPFSISGKGHETVATFKVVPPSETAAVQLEAVAKIDDQSFNRSYSGFNYKHVPAKSYFPKAVARAVRLSMEMPVRKIGYIMGTGDEVAKILLQLGYPVTMLSDDALAKEDLSQFDTILTGVRAYTVRHRLAQLHDKLLAFVKEGGTLIIQYNPNRRLVRTDLGPFPFVLSRDRVTEEDAPITLLAPEHRLLNWPNKITQNDFSGWVQERGLYFGRDEQGNYEKILSSHDTGQASYDGGLLYAKSGKGIFIYTGYSWFRQLPAGVPGAFRVFLNLISAQQ